MHIYLVILFYSGLFPDKNSDKKHSSPNQANRKQQHLKKKEYKPRPQPHVFHVRTILISPAGLGLSPHEESVGAEKTSRSARALVGPPVRIR